VYTLCPKYGINATESSENSVSFCHITRMRHNIQEDNNIQLIFGSDWCVCVWRLTLGW